MKVARFVAAVVVVAGLAAAAPAAGARTPKPKTAVNRAWAGYVLTDPGGDKLAFTAVSATWKQPKMTCRAGMRDAVGIWVGLGGYVGNGLEQTGVGTACPDGAIAVSTPWYEILPAYAATLRRHHVKPGDMITASVEVLGKAHTSVRFLIEDRTQGWRIARTLLGASTDLSSAEWIIEPPRSCNAVWCLAPLGRFTAVTLTNISVVANGHRGTILDRRWQATAVHLVPSEHEAARSGSTAGARPHDLAPDGTSFGLAWLADAVRLERPKPVKPPNPLFAGPRRPA